MQKKRDFKVVLESYDIESNIHAPVLLNLSNLLRKRVKCEACREFYLFFATSLINSIEHEHSCKILYVNGDV